jgi:AbrB family looped-hinge helix DNA binding protein
MSLKKNNLIYIIFEKNTKKYKYKIYLINLTMATETIDLGKISSRGQVAIPSEIRQKMKLEEGSKIVFLLEDDLLIIKKITAESFSEITKPFREAKKKIKEEDVVNLVHNARKNTKKST